MQFKRVLPISDNLTAHKKPSYKNRTPALIQQQYVQAFEASGLAQVQFCGQQNIPYKTFTNWLRRYRSHQFVTEKSADNDNAIVITTQEEKTIRKGQATTHITCALPNRLSITLSPIALADLSTLIEALSTCRLN